MSAMQQHIPSDMQTMIAQMVAAEVAKVTEAFKSEYGALERDYSGLFRSHQAWETYAAEQEQRVARAEAEAERWRERAEQMDANMTAMKFQLDTMQREGEDNRARIAQLEAENAGLREEVHTLRQNVEYLDAELTAQVAKTDDLVRRVYRLEMIESQDANALTGVWSDYTPDYLL